MTILIHLPQRTVSQNASFTLRRNHALSLARLSFFWACPTVQHEVLWNQLLWHFPQRAIGPACGQELLRGGTEEQFGACRPYTFGTTFGLKKWLPPGTPHMWKGFGGRTIGSFASECGLNRLERVVCPDVSDRVKSCERTP